MGYNGRTPSFMTFTSPHRKNSSEQNPLPPATPPRRRQPKKSQTPPKEKTKRPWPWERALAPQEDTRGDSHRSPKTPATPKKIKRQRRFFSASLHPLKINWRHHFQGPKHPRTAPAPAPAPALAHIDEKHIIEGSHINALAQALREHPNTDKFTEEMKTIIATLPNLSGGADDRVKATKQFLGRISSSLSITLYLPLLQGILDYLNQRAGNVSQEINPVIESFLKKTHALGNICWREKIFTALDTTLETSLITTCVNPLIYIVQALLDIADTEQSDDEGDLTSMQQSQNRKGQLIGEALLNYRIEGWKKSKQKELGEQPEESTLRSVLYDVLTLSFPRKKDVGSGFLLKKPDIDSLDRYNVAQTYNQILEYHVLTLLAIEAKSKEPQEITPYVTTSLMCHFPISPPLDSNLNTQEAYMMRLTQHYIELYLITKGRAEYLNHPGSEIIIQGLANKYKSLLTQAVDRQGQKIPEENCKQIVTRFQQKLAEDPTILSSTTPPTAPCNTVNIPEIFTIKKQTKEGDTGKYAYNLKITDPQTDSNLLVLSPHMIRSYSNFLNLCAAETCGRADTTLQLIFEAGQTPPKLQIKRGPDEPICLPPTTSTIENGIHLIKTPTGYNLLFLSDSRQIQIPVLLGANLNEYPNSTLNIEAENWTHIQNHNYGTLINRFNIADSNALRQYLLTATLNGETLLTALYKADQEPVRKSAPHQSHLLSLINLPNDEWPQRERLISLFPDAAFKLLKGQKETALQKLDHLLKRYKTTIMVLESIQQALFKVIEKRLKQMNKHVTQNNLNHTIAALTSNRELSLDIFNDAFLMPLFKAPIPESGDKKTYTDHIATIFFTQHAHLIQIGEQAEFKTDFHDIFSSKHNAFQTSSIPTSPQAASSSQTPKDKLLSNEKLLQDMSKKIKCMQENSGIIAIAFNDLVSYLNNKITDSWSSNNAELTEKLKDTMGFIAELEKKPTNDWLSLFQQAQLKNTLATRRKLKRLSSLPWFLSCFSCFQFETNSTGLFKAAHRRISEHLIKSNDVNPI